MNKILKCCPYSFCVYVVFNCDWLMHKTAYWLCCTFLLCEKLQNSQKAFIPKGVAQLCKCLTDEQLD